MRRVCAWLETAKGGMSQLTGTGVIGRSAGMPTSTFGEAEVKRILGLSVPITVVLAERLMPVEAAIAIRVGTIIEFDVLFDEEPVLFVGNRPIAKGQAVKVGENFGLRVTKAYSVEDRIAAMGGK